MDAAKYSVPQKRMRGFFVGLRADEDKLWTHSADALLLSQWASGEYWVLHKLATRHRPPRPAGVEKKIRTLVDPTTR